FLMSSSAAHSIWSLSAPARTLNEAADGAGTWDEEVTKWWGEWSSWSTCSRSCGGGVTSRERHCLRQRLQIPQGTNSTMCVGQAKHYQLCQQQPCPANTASFKQQQCSSFNAKAFGKHYYHWMPLYPDDYTSISNKPCDLQCTTRSGERQLMARAQDGTSCKDRTYQGVCINGKCEPVGCDGSLNSPRTMDRCRVCGGDGSTCHRVSGTFRKAISQIGYVFITNIPAGATDILIIERRKTENILALADESGHFFFNGNSAIDNPQNFRVAGTVFKYRRPSSLNSDGLEYIIAQGPTNQSLNAMVCEEPEYTLVPKPNLEPWDVLQAPSLQAPLPARAPQLRLLQGAAAPGSQAGPQELHSQALAPLATGPPQSPGSQELAGGLEGGGVCWESGGSSQLQQDGICAELPARGQPDRQHQPGRASASFAVSVHQWSALPKVGEMESRNTGFLSIFKDSKEELSYISCLQQFFSLLAHTTSFFHSNEFDVSPVGHDDISLADMYRWKVSAYAPCSSTCTSGISTSYAMCVRYDGVEVDESYCDALTRPEPTHEFCTGRDCQPRWETSRWSECSRTCGEGSQYRTVRCWKMLAPGFDSSVYDELCEAAGLARPMERKACKNKACGPQWELSEWSECSARCGTAGTMKREVRCSVEAPLCDESLKPSSEKECTGPPCDRRWTASDWGPCSGPCGEGRMSRFIACRNLEGKVISSSQCDPATKPLAVHPCGDKNCPAHWVEQEWEQCDTSCGRGVKTRLVLCVGLENGLYREYPEKRCETSPKPEEQAVCFRRPCSTWFTTSWSQCSKTCGAGVRLREVKCYQGEALAQGCDPSAKPEARQACQLQPCPTEAPEDACEDKATANCVLVLKVKLCSHWYYRKACCWSCRLKSS
uniref:ADAMTS-like protein 2 n=1 Tax=Serinus canaria TaxID=9135 RepID=A0A8C9N5Z6_SERCA